MWYVVCLLSRSQNRLWPSCANQRSHRSVNYHYDSSRQSIYAIAMLWPLVIGTLALYTLCRLVLAITC